MNHLEPRPRQRTPANGGLNTPATPSLVADRFASEIASFAEISEARKWEPTLAVEHLMATVDRIMSDIRDAFRESYEASEHEIPRRVRLCGKSLSKDELSGFAGLVVVQSASPFPTYGLGLDVAATKKFVTAVGA